MPFYTIRYHDPATAQDHTVTIPAADPETAWRAATANARAHRLEVRELLGQSGNVLLDAATYHPTARR